MKHLLFPLLVIVACFQAHAGNNANSTNYIQEWGRLQLIPYEVDLGQHQRSSWGGEPDYTSKQLCDQEGFPIQLKGFSAFGQDHKNCLKSKEDLINLREMGVNCIRIARLISGEGKISDEQVKQWMAWTNETGLYCIIDWHFMNELNEKKEDSGDPNDYIEEASEFFRMVAQEVADKQYKHILYEVCNEPSGVEWETIKSYAETIIDIITGIDTNKPIIIVGTPDWCQKTYQVANSQNLIETDKAGIMYSFHYFAGEPAHQNLVATGLQFATTAIPIIVTEWNLGKAPNSEETEENDPINTESGALFLQTCAVNNMGNQLVSWIYNSYGYGGNRAALFNDECGGDLSAAGRFISEHIGTINYKDGPRQNYHVKNWGRLNIVWSQLSDENGKPIQLKGFTAFSPGYENCLNTKEDLDNLRETGVNCVRIARHISGEGKISDEQIKQWMEWTYEAGLYCIIDWHFMSELNEKKEGSGDPNDYIEEASEFFQMVAQEVADKQYKHILYEICNEPSGVDWGTIKSYAKTIANIITDIDTNRPIIIVGTPNWCQRVNSEVDATDNNVISGKAGIMYAFHFYAGETAHIALESSEFLPATKRVPVIVTEWSLGRLPENTTAENNKINTEGGNQFFNHCLGSDGSQQIVSWIYNSYGSGGNGGAMYKDECGGDLTVAGKHVDIMLRDKCCVPEPIPYHIFHFTKNEELTMNLGFYNENSLKQDGEWASGSGICYYDANISGVGEFNAGNERETEITYNRNTGEEYEALICQAGRQWTSFRVDECVDVEPAFIEGSWDSGLYSVNWIDAGEWILYTVDVETAGYYSMQMAVNNLEYKSMKYPEFRLSLTDYPEENIMVDIDKSTNTAEVLLESSGNCTGFIPYTKVSVTETQPENEEDLIWCYTGDTLESIRNNVKTNYGLLFKKTGQYTLKLSFPTKYPALGGLKFNYSKPWSGEGYNEGTGIATTQEATISVYPTIVEEGRFNVSTTDKATVQIYNVTGSLVQSEEINGSSEISTRLAPGLYNVRVIQEEDAQTTKIIIR